MRILYANIVIIFILSHTLSGCNSSPEKRMAPRDSSARNLNHDVSVPVHNAAVDTSKYQLSIEKYRDSVDRHIGSFNILKKEIFGESAEGGEVELYMKKADTVKVKATYYGETGKAEYVYYLKGNKLVFANRKMVYYNKPIGKVPVRIDITDIGEFLIYDNAVLFGKRRGNLVPQQELELYSDGIEDFYSEILSQVSDSEPVE